jgi:hypothetical protein
MKRRLLRVIAGLIPFSIVMGIFASILSGGIGIVCFLLSAFGTMGAIAGSGFLIVQYVLDGDWDN